MLLFRFNTTVLVTVIGSLKRTCKESNYFANDTSIEKRSIKFYFWEREKQSCGDGKKSDGLLTQPEGIRTEERRFN